MKWIFGFVFLAAAAWSGYWFVGARAQEKIYADLIAHSRDQGWTAESRHLGVSGFPNRFDTTLTGLNIRDPSGRWGWRADRFTIKSLSYQPNHIIMAWPGAQVVETPAGSVTLNAGLLRASLVVAPARTLPLSRFQIEGHAVALDGAQIGAAHIGTLNGALFQDEPGQARYRLGLDLRDVTPPPGLTSDLAGQPILPGPIGLIRLSAHVLFEKEIDRLALSNGQPPGPVSLEIESATLNWGDSTIELSGTLARGANGFIEGALQLDVKNWQPLYDLFRQGAHLTAPQRITLKRALDGASAGGDLRVTLEFRDGHTRIGPLTIGPAPTYPF